LYLFLIFPMHDTSSVLFMLLDLITLILFVVEYDHKLQMVLIAWFSNIIFFHWLYSPIGPWLLFFSFMIILQTVGLLGRVISPSQGFYLNTGQHKHRINTYTHQTSMSSVGFEPTIPASERAKIVPSLAARLP
jgi:hypothetical protein